MSKVREDTTQPADEYDPEFVKAWKAQEGAGYIYSESNIAKVYFGWQLARQAHSLPGDVGRRAAFEAGYRKGQRDLNGNVQAYGMDASYAEYAAALTPSPLSGGESK